MTFNRIVRVNVTVAGSVIDTTLQTSIAHDGVTFTFDRPMPVGRFVTNEPFVVSDQSFAITAITPISADLQGNGYVGNGTMKDPFFDDEMQGFDQYLADFPTKSTAEIPYSAAKNIDPAIAGNIVLAQGETTSIVKTVRNPNKTSNTGSYAMIGKYVVLSVLDAPPPVGAVRPGMAGTVKRLRSVNDVTFTPRGFALPAGWPDLATIIAETPKNLGLLSRSGERRRILKLDTALGTTNDGYSAEHVDAHARYVAALNSTAPTAAQRDEMIARILTHSNDLEAVLDAGFNVGGGAGQGGGVWLWGMAGAALLRDNTLHQKVRAAGSQPDTPFWVAAANVGTPAPGKSGVAAQTYFDEHIGMPHIEPDEAGSHYQARYMSIAAFITGWEAVSILAFNQGPPGFANGYEMILNGGPDDESNRSAAIVGLLSRMMTWQPNPQGSYGYNNLMEGLWNIVVADGDLVPWTGRPDQPPMGVASNLNDAYFSAGAGAITLNTHGINHKTEAVTQIDLRYSIDNVQFVEIANIAPVGNFYTQTGLLRGVPHWCGWRRHSVSGVSPWSANHPYNTPILSGDDRSKVTTTGTEPIAAPSWAGRPQPTIHARLYPGWAYPTWKSVSGTLDFDDVELSAGVGYPSGFPAPSFEAGDFTFQWKRDGVAIPGQTAQTYTRVAADAGAVLTCDVTATTAQGTATVTTPGVTCPAIQSPPPGTLVDTDFRGAFAIDYETELLSATTARMDIYHLQNAVPGGFAEANFGALHFNKTSSNPEGYITLSRAAAPSTVYDVSGQIVIEGDSETTNKTITFTIEEDGGAVLYTETIDGNDVVAQPGDDYLLNFAGQLTTGASISTLIVKIGFAISSGGFAGGDIYLTQLKIAEAV